MCGSSPHDYRLRFSRGPVLVKTNTSDSPFDQANQKMCLSLDQLEEIAGGVDERLVAEARSGP